ncbi:MAG: Polyphenol oxidase [Herminiimonas sp.]|nr:Polyphenol oxidase [Herminiimonas sp.]
MTPAMANSETDFIMPDWNAAPAEVGALSTTRHGGVSRAPYDDGAGGGGMNLGAHVGDRPEDVLQNRAMLEVLLPAHPAWLTQVHGARVVDAATVSGAPEADASFTTQSGVVCAIQTADCLPVLFCDTAGRAVGAAHAGWRGLASGVLQNTVAAMRDAGAAEIIAWLGPAIGPQQFEVGPDVVDAFDALGCTQAFKPIDGQPGKYLADIYALARAALQSVGVQRIDGGGFCTVTEAQRFYSYRRDRVTGRMATLIWLKFP